MTNIQAAIGCAQLKNIKYFYKKRATIENFYNEELKNFRGFGRQKMFSESSKVEWLYTLTFKNCKIVSLIRYLKKNKIETRRIFYPFHQMKIYEKYIPKKFDGSNSIFIFKNGISLPTYYELKNTDLKKIVSKISMFFKKS